MTNPLMSVLALLAAATVMFALSRPRMDVVALIVIAIFPLTGVLTIGETLAGFSDPTVVLIALMFVLGEGLVRTGIAQRMGDWLIARAGASETVLIVALMTTVALVGSVMSSTGVVAIFIPIVLRICQKTRLSPRRLMMPLSVGALVSGMTTLVATSPNLVVNGELLRSKHAGFGFFSFTPFGVPLLLLAIGYMLLARRLLGAATVAETHAVVRPTLLNWVEEYGLAAREFRVRVDADSRLIGRSIGELDLRRRGLNILAIERSGRFALEMIRPNAQTTIHAGDIIFLDVQRDATMSRSEAELAADGLTPLALTGQYFTDQAQEIGMAELIVPADSRLPGKTVIQAGIRSEYDLSVIGMKRGLAPLTENVLDTPLKAGDTLLVVGPWRAIRRLRANATHTDLLPFNLPAEFEQSVPAARSAPLALAALAITVGLMVSGALPAVHAALVGCLLMGLFRCVDLAAAYRAIHWPTLILIVGMFPFSLALRRTGGVDLASGALVSMAGADHPRLLLAGLFVVTAVVGSFISNTATAVLMAPVAVAIAGQLGMSPLPFAMTVALAASTAFATPFSSPVNTLVVGPGKYTFGDFVVIGLPLALIFLIACVLMIPIVMPFQPN